MYKEEFVPFEISKKLQEKGFKQDYNIFGYKVIFSDEDAIKYISDIGAYEKGYFGINIPCPSINEVLKWLREEKGVYVSIETFPTFSTKNKVHFCYTIKTESDGSSMKVIESEYTYCEYSEAELNCIEYIIDNILQIKQNE